MTLGGKFRDLDFAGPGDSTYSATEDSAEHGFSKLKTSSQDPVTYENLGRGEGLDQDNVGDIADEGRGHRG